MELHRVKSVNHDKRSKKRIRYASAKERSKKASADVYRTFDRGSGSNSNIRGGGGGGGSGRSSGGGLTSAATREAYVHNPRRDDRAKKRQRKHHEAIGSSMGATFTTTKKKTTETTTAITVGTANDETQNSDGNSKMVVEYGDPLEDSAMEKELISSTTTFASELDVAVDRNASEIFGAFHRKVWRLVRSLPEILHNVEEIIDIHLAYMLSPAAEPGTVSPGFLQQRQQQQQQQEEDPEQSMIERRSEFVINHATTDILHLLAVLARDLRHEIHPYLHTKIIPRIIYDLLNPPPPPPELEKQPIPLDVTIVEAALRTLSYIFKYDLQNVVEEMDVMRKYYGVTLGNRRELVRRLSAETFAPLIRKMKSRKDSERHVRRVLKALASTGAPDPLNRQLIRSQTDAVDGISQLLFLLIRGPVRGKFYSRGDSMFQFILSFVCGGSSTSKHQSRSKDAVREERNEKHSNNNGLVFDVGSSILDRLCHHFDPSTFQAVSKIMFDVVKTNVDSYMDCLESNEGKKVAVKTNIDSTINGLKLLVQVVSFHSGRLLQNHSVNHLKPFCGCIETLCGRKFVGSLDDQDTESDVVVLICQLLAYFQSSGTTLIRAVDFLRNMLDTDDLPMTLIHTRSLMLARELLPHMQIPSERAYAVSLLFDAAGRVAETDDMGSIEVLFTVISHVQSSREAENKDSDFEIFGVNKEDDIDLSQSVYDLLMDTVLTDVGSEFTTARDTGLAIAAVKVRCIPFLLSLHPKEIEKSKIHKKVISWLMHILDLPQLSSGSLSQDQVILEALALEATSIVLDRIRDGINSPLVLKAAQKAVAAACDLLINHSESVWVLRGTASLLPVLTECKMTLTDDPNKMFELIIPNLASTNHFLRLYSLKILSNFPKKPFVVDHAELDLEGDLDEEPSTPSVLSSSIGNRSGPVGPCDILDTLLLLESSPVSLPGERQLLGLISKVEVLARTGRLPAEYVEAAACHMLGMMNVKFSPVWPASRSAVATLVTSYEKFVWPYLEKKLRDVMAAPSADGGDEDNKGDSTENIFDGHLNMCKRWESSNGANVDLAGAAFDDKNDDAVPCFHTADPETVMESVWKIAEMKQKVFAHHSRVVVPVFINFLRNQYFEQHSDDQDALELDLAAYAQEEACLNLQGYVLQKRLKAFLLTFAAVEGPQQLVHHKALEAIYRAFLGHQDPSIADLALSCLLTFKFEYLQPHADRVKAILVKGSLRGSLLKLGEDLEKVHEGSDHYKPLVPVLSRILFGRVTSRSRKSAKDSPKARRAAILSFLSVLCRDEEDLFSFLYLMTRSFLPKTAVREPIENFTPDKRDAVMKSLLEVTSDDLTALSSAVVEGFLHLLENIVSQWGHRIINWVPALTRIVVETHNLVAVNSDFDSSKLKAGTIRSLCFQRMCEMLLIFGGQTDFSKYLESFWTHIRTSLDLLPEMGVANEGCPALLTLLQAMTNDSSLISMLVAHDESIVAIIKCISGLSSEPVISASLSSIENLLTVMNDESEAIGRKAIDKHKMLLMNQFTVRLGYREENNSGPAKLRPSTSRRPNARSRTWRRELEVLMKISELLNSDAEDGHNSQSEFAFSLCNLLLPFIHQAAWVIDEDKSRILNILDPITSLLTTNESKQFYFDVADALAPGRSNSGVQNLSIRRSISAVLKKAARFDENMDTVASAVEKLCSVHPKLVDEMDFDTVIPQLNALADESKNGFWMSMRLKESFNPSALTPIINELFHLLYSDDGVIQRASYHGLRALVSVVVQQSVTDANQALPWEKMMESAVVPMMKSGLQSRSVQARRHCILLLRETTNGFSDNESPGLCGDLMCLYDDENHDLDFFLSITHVQIHRRARGFQRLRKTLALLQDGTLSPSIGQQSLSGVLLPLALHPIFECKSKTEEGFALDAIATVGAISRSLSWSKYNNTLWTLLNQFERHPEQQKYLVGALCAIFDGFHFDLVNAPDDPDADDFISKTSVWRALENRIIPKVEDLLVKESTDRHGNKVKTLRPSIVLALLKLFQKFPPTFLDERLPRLLAVVCNALCDKDSSARDLARTTIAKMVVSMDLKYLPDVVRELAVTLNEGYKLHVRAAAIHSILLELSKVYEPSKLSLSGEGLLPLPFDDCVPALMDLIQQDLFGEANERREASETNVRYVKESGGSKSIHSVEMISRMVSFAPSLVATKGTSGVHSVVSPLLQRLQVQTVDAKTIKKIREILTRAVVGFSNNKTISTDELMPFVFSTLQPFTGSPDLQIFHDNTSDDENSIDESGYAPIKVSGSSNRGDTESGSLPVKAAVATWQPSTLGSASSSRAAAELRREERRKLRQVLDGASAPKLTGSMRHGTIDAIDSSIINEPSTITAITFGLSLLNSSLKKIDTSSETHTSHIMDPFIPMLTSIVCTCRQTEVALLSLKCLTMIFDMNLDLPSASSCSKSIGKQALALLASTGASFDKNRDLSQACFRTLTYLINTDSQTYSSTKGEDALSKNTTLPLDAEQMKVVISLVQVSITDSDQHNPAIGLVKALMSRKFISPEFYDLMELVCKEVARSSKANLRQICATIFVRFLLDYPMGEEKFEYHIKQVVANLSYEYEDGRLSSQMMLFSLLEKLPNELIERHARLFFLPLVLQLVNDESKQCRERVQKCIILLLTRSSAISLQSFHEYCSKWCQEDGQLKVASLQIFGLLFEARADFVRANSVDQHLLPQIVQNLHERIDKEWEITYFSLLCIEKVSKPAGYFLNQVGLLNCVVDCMMDLHPWIKLSSTRIAYSVISSKDAISVLEQQRGLLFRMVRQICSQLNAKEDEYSEELSHLSIRSLCMAVPLMAANPRLCYLTVGEDDDEKNEDEEGDKEKNDPIFWMMRRLSQVCKNKGKKRRIGIFKLYAALSMQHFDIVGGHVELMLEGLHRSIVEATNEEETKAASEKRRKVPSRFDSACGDEMTEHAIAESVVGQLEESCSTPEDFINAYASVKRRARDKKMKRKSELKTEAVQDQQAAVERKFRKHDREKNRRKRRSEEHRYARGGEKKIRHGYT